MVQTGADPFLRDEVDNSSSMWVKRSFSIRSRFLIYCAAAGGRSSKLGRGTTGGVVGNVAVSGAWKAGGLLNSGTGMTGGDGVTKAEGWSWVIIWSVRGVDSLAPGGGRTGVELMGADSAGGVASGGS